LVSKGFAKQKAFVGGVEMPDLATENWLMPTLMLMMMMMMLLMLMLMLMLLMIIQKMFRMTKQDVRCIPGLRRNTPSWLASQGGPSPMTILFDVAKPPVWSLPSWIGKLWQII
jgi:hypothetical protein